jgi:hypothetical protein
MSAPTPATDLGSLPKVNSGLLSKLKKLPTNPQDLLQAKQDASEVQAPEEEEDIRTGAFTESDLWKHWEEFAAMRKMELKELEYHVMQQPVTLEDTRVIVSITNPVQEDILSGFKTELVTYLRNKLANGRISVEPMLVAPDQTKLIYTNREKFQYLAEKKPALQLLKDRLDLDPDF